MTKLATPIQVYSAELAPGHYCVAKCADLNLGFGLVAATAQ